jgi:hypothetical protein
MPITFKPALELSARYGGWSLSLTGSGEPTCSPDAVTNALKEYSEVAAKGAYFPNVNLFTNGILLGDDEFCAKYLPVWKSLGLTAIAVSVHSVFESEQAIRSLKVKGAEGDDIIGVLARTPGEHIVISADADITQLTRFPNVKAYNPIRKQFVDNGRDYWHQKVLTGDSGDDVPNILSDDDTFADGRKMNTLSAKKKADILSAVDPEEEILSQTYTKGLTPEQVLKNYRRNKLLIDLTQIPTEVVDRIHAARNDPNFKRGDLTNLCVRLNCPDYINKLNDFTINEKHNHNGALDVF